MKNLKFVVAIVGITVATFGTSYNAHAKQGLIACKGAGTGCGYDANGNYFEGNLTSN